MPALLTRMSMPPNSATAAFTAPAAVSSCETSPGNTTYRASGPSDAAVSSSRSERRPTRTTAAPSRAKARAVAAPSPVPAPVTTATLESSNLKGVGRATTAPVYQALTQNQYTQYDPGRDYLERTPCRGRAGDGSAPAAYRQRGEGPGAGRLL